ncbi:MAG: hypothetical protein JNJ83_13590 [Verrucomicrobiaceae bacterium]|nr:hypothetical protein [Verrucomicrobiaceae bacterium]
MSQLAIARDLVKLGRIQEAAALMLTFARQVLELDCTEVKLTPDGYSLNSLNGILSLGTPFEGQTKLFFKYHQEEDESKGVAEYYNSKLLEDAGLPVDVPLAARHNPGEQILLYRVRTDPRLADVCRAIEHGQAAGFTAEETIQAQRDLDIAVGKKYLETLTTAPREKPAAEPLHQLFYLRLVDDPNADAPVSGGRLKSFYVGKDFAFPGLEKPLSWAELANLRWCINGVTYTHTLGELFAEAMVLLAPRELPDPCPVVLGHGDAHNANLWIERDSAGSARLAFFDPAFAGAALPALLAEIKPTFHNIFAHPDWLYHSSEVTQRYQTRAEVRDGVLHVHHDWKLNALRAEFLATKVTHVWKPLLAEIKAQGLLPADWERYIRLALFCCPTLVMNLRAGADRHNPVSSVVGLSIAMMCGSAGDTEDVMSQFIADITP